MRDVTKRLGKQLKKLLKRAENFIRPPVGAGSAPKKGTIAMTSQAQTQTDSASAPAPTNSIRDLVNEALKDSGERVKQILVTQLVDEQVKKRADALTVVFNNIEALEKALKSFRPDLQTFKDDGSIASEAWSKDHLNRRKKLEEQLHPLKAAMKGALENNVWDKLIEISKKPLQLDKAGDKGKNEKTEE
jgi:hypothetical protein